MKKSKADKINYSLVFQPPEYDPPQPDKNDHDEDWDQEAYDQWHKEFVFKDTEYSEAREWLDQFYPCVQQTISTGRKILLIVGDESWVKQVWSMKNDNYKGVCYLEYENPDQ